MFQFYGRLQPFIRSQPFIFLIFPLIFGLISIILARINFAFGFFLIILIIPLLFSYAAIGWGIYPALVTTEKFFDKKGYSNVVLEYRVIKNFLLILIPLIILNNLIVIIGGNNAEDLGIFIIPYYKFCYQIMFLQRSLEL